MSCYYSLSACDKHHFNVNLTDIPVNFSNINTIVIDPGHGGKDAGCNGKHSTEKHVVLELALSLGEKINLFYPHIEVIYTRKTDVFIPLHIRTKIANENKADLFLSIHCNAFPSKYASGTETYVMGLHTTEYNLNIAKRENSSVLLEDDYTANYDGYDPNSPEGHIILSMYQNANLEQSIEVAQLIENQFDRLPNMKSKGVKQAGFVVLKRATMPSVLIETGFLTNPKDEAILSSRKGKKSIVESIFTGLSSFIDSPSTSYNAYAQTNSNNNSSYYQSKAAPSFIQVKNNTTTVEIINKPSNNQEVIPYNKPKPDNYYKPSGTANAEKASNAAQAQKEVAKKDFILRPAKPALSTSAAKPNMNNKPKTPRIPYNSSGKKKVNYSVQIAATKEKCNPLEKLGIKNIAYTTIYEDGMFKYLSGIFDDMSEAYEHRKMLLEKGFQGAFLVAYDENIRLNIEKARSITNGQ
jgi:N-acetylmuramoyl-L-alanine amidase